MPPFGVLGALQFLTRIPIRLRSAPDLASSVPWFPVVGALIGAATGGVAAGLMEVVPTTVAATLAIVLGVMMTGAFHEDGLADTADAMGGWTQERRREILKDSRHGSYGVAAMCSTIVLRILCVATLGPGAAFAGLVAAHTLGRGAAVGVMGTAPPVPTDGLGADYARSLSTIRAAIGVVASLAIATAAVGWWVLPIAAAVAVGALLVSLLAHRAFGGVSGDILGAVEQVGECLALVVVSGLALHHRVWWT
ncbi:MAG: adenosylcobinamide-GDP ribazoletransferase [Ilumatobacter sp.]|uniref:adenosylcobinamide-GDP ribazoletransferase n=1 Tax=Ilumatobacter sp. TaxID=1967498 RepID=UPI003C76B23F